MSTTPAFTASAELPHLGEVKVAVSDFGVAAIGWVDSQAEWKASLHKRGFAPCADDGRAAGMLQQLDEYLRGKRKSFQVPVDYTGLTEFQKHVLQATAAIPYGEVRTYGELAASLSRPRAARAVGQVERNNPVPLLVPCHRVVGSDGSMRGYGGPGGTGTKRLLLELEKDVCTV